MKVRIFFFDTNRLGKIIAVALLLACAFAITHATPVNPSALPATAKPVVKANPAPLAAKTTGTKSDWNKLTPAQRQALAPLAADWNKLDSFRKEKWLELANKFATMQPADQARMQERMRDWMKLSPEQRRIARESYTRVKKLDAEKKSRQWEQYQQLPDEKKRELAATAPPKKQIVNPPRLTGGTNAPQAKTAPKHVPAKQPLPTAEAIQP